MILLEGIAAKHIPSTTQKAHLPINENQIVSLKNNYLALSATFKIG
jgi:hypothetical protein